MLKIDKKAIDDIFAKRITPLLAVDGGRVELVDIDNAEGNVKVRFGGTYRGSPCQGVVLRYIVEPLLKEAVSGIVSVVMVD